jgi:hypothetical protein
MKTMDTIMKRFFSASRLPRVLAAAAVMTAVLFLSGFPAALKAADRSVKIKHPNGGEVIAAGSRTTITWVSRGLSANEKMVIILYKKGIKHSVIAKQTPNSGKFSWNVPRRLHTGSDYRVRIRAIKNLAVNDFSDRNFTIK